MKTELIEFNNSKGDILRGILTHNQGSKRGVVLTHGFERTAITEKKFKDLSDSLTAKGISCFRFDYTGCGLSDGDFASMSVASMTGDLEKAIESFRRRTKIKNIGIVAHSLAGCVVANYLENMGSFKKVVLLSPALNQRDLLRYYFTKGYMAKTNPSVKIDWNSFRKHLDEKLFIQDFSKSKKMAKAHYIGKKYYLENMNRDYSDIFYDKNNILFVYGNKDDRIPLEGIDLSRLKKVIIVQGGDHDLERPDMYNQWNKKTVNFLVRE